MKRNLDTDDRFEWDMTTVILLVFAVLIIGTLVMLFGPFDHTT